MKELLNQESIYLKKKKAKDFRRALWHIAISIFIVVSMLISLQQNGKKIELQKVIIKNQIDLSQKVNKLWENLK